MSHIYWIADCSITVNWSGLVWFGLESGTNMAPLFQYLIYN